MDQVMMVQELPTGKCMHSIITCMWSHVHATSFVISNRHLLARGFRCVFVRCVVVLCWVVVLESFITASENSVAVIRVSVLKV